MPGNDGYGHPEYGLPMPHMVSGYSLCSLGVEMTSFHASTPASAAWSTANRGFFFPFYAYNDFVLTQFFLVNGATATANVSLGLYRDSDLSLVVGTASTAQSGASAIQFLDVTDTDVAGAARYYCGLALSATTGTVFRTGSGSDVNREMGCTEMAAALPMPATLTLTACSMTGFPLFGFTTL